MSAPQVVSVQPDVGATDVVLSLPITVTFDQVIDTGTVDPSTFSVTYSAPSQVVTTGDLIAGRSPSSTVCVDGSWTFSTNSSNQTVAVFTPTRPLNPNTLFTVTLLGTDAALTSAVIANPGGEAMTVSYHRRAEPEDQVSSSCRNRNTSRARARNARRIRATWATCPASCTRSLGFVGRFFSVLSPLPTAQQCAVERLFSVPAAAQTPRAHASKASPSHGVIHQQSDE